MSSKETLYLGSSPVEEPCAQVGQYGYYPLAKAECDRYQALIVKKFGPPPEGAVLHVKEYHHDYGSYLELVLDFDPDSVDQRDYAAALDNEGPLRWDDDAPVEWRVAPTTPFPAMPSLADDVPVAPPDFFWEPLEPPGTVYGVFRAEDSSAHPYGLFAEYEDAVSYSNSFRDRLRAEGCYVDVFVAPVRKLAGEFWNGPPPPDQEKK